MKSILKTAVMTALFILPLSGSRAGYVEVTAASDTWLNGSGVDTVYDGLGYLWIAPGRNGLVKIDLTGQIPAGQAVTNAILEIYVNEKSGSPSVNIYAETDDWVEATATWNKKDGSIIWGGSGGGFGAGMTSGSNIIVSQTVSSTGLAQFDVTGAVQGWYDGSIVNRGLLMQGQGTSTYFKFYDRTNTTYNNKPKLKITYDALTCAAVWSSGSGITYDFNHDCYVDFKDLSIFLEDFLKCNDPQIIGCND